MAEPKKTPNLIPTKIIYRRPSIPNNIIVSPQRTPPQVKPCGCGNKK